RGKKQVGQRLNGLFHVSRGASRPGLARFSRSKFQLHDIRFWPNNLGLVVIGVVVGIPLFRPTLNGFAGFLFFIGFINVVCRSNLIGNSVLVALVVLIVLAGVIVTFVRF